MSMAEFCLDCWNKINETNDPPRKYVISKHLDLCEGCGQMTHVILMERKYFYRRILRLVFFPLKIVFTIFYTLWRILILPYSIYKQKKKKP